MCLHVCVQNDGMEEKPNLEQEEATWCGLEGFHTTKKENGLSEVQRFSDRKSQHEQIVIDYGVASSIDRR